MLQINNNFYNCTLMFFFLNEDLQHYVKVTDNCFKKLIFVVA